jgi:urocanate hydratase
MYDAPYLLRLTEADVPAKTPAFVENIRRAPRRTANLSANDIRLALKNALRYIPPAFHEELSQEFLQELLTHGRIYGYRFRPKVGFGVNRLISIPENLRRAKRFKS